MGLSFACVISIALMMKRPLEMQQLERHHALIWNCLGPLPDHLRIIEMIQNIRLLDSRNIILPAEFGIRICNQLSRRHL